MLTAEVPALNDPLWDVENAIRFRRRDGDPGTGLVDLARSVYKNNDRCAAIKRPINDRLGSQITG